MSVKWIWSTLSDVGHIKLQCVSLVWRDPSYLASYFHTPAPTSLQGLYWIHPCLPMIIHIRSVAPAIMNEFFPYLAQLITSIKRCVSYNGIWPWHIASSSTSYNLAIKLLKYGTSFHVHSTAQNGLFSYLVQVITSMRGCIMCDDF